ncbi:hypothetical protein SELR_pSRC102360 (plasmid) [Selenomonas ruminantium subsp. lactilytica TAM6421]|uniref:Uncharacterized protein n=1 Tax=Selenomonas ruminantium subsp. lactilytica (strain NBRC 103574 / TAM6421) TaxID=927704 RepID=I0GWA6_SELRL|nr:hypothetical protein [Selenomonas ruminantium]BAL85043.1 hypothetical protein SELR_pSRC102360 [Selenomonas ruminantium subsp. lactilytica TAM6421]
MAKKNNNELEEAKTTKDGYEIFLEKIKVDKEQFINWGVDAYSMPNEDKAKNEWDKLKKRIDDKRRKLNNEENVYIRKYGRSEGSKELYIDFYKEVFGLEICTDPTNNKEPQEILKRLVADENKTNYINYQVSHVWGKTKNMYMFSAPWNIMLIPKMFDPLTGHEAKGDLPRRFQKALRQKIYNKYRELIIDYNKLIWDEYLNNEARREKCKKYYDKIEKKIKPKGNLGRITNNMFKKFKISIDSEFVMIDKYGKTTTEKNNVEFPDAIEINSIINTTSLNV